MFWEWTLCYAVLSIIASAADIGTGKPAYQITTVQIPGVSAAHFQPGLAVDGTKYCHYWFSHTNNHQMPWWAVDLGDYYIIDNVQVTPRAWSDGYSGNFKILVGSERYSLNVRSTFIQCASGYGNEQKLLQCTPWPVVGRHVVVQREKENVVRNLCLCEVVVQGRKACDGGKTGSKCETDCSDGKWGPQCAFTCSTGCRNTCDKVTGACQCEDGWFGDLCKVCPSGRYGQNCSKECSSGCRQDNCSNVDGTCECLNTRYRQNCTGNCGSGCLALPCNKTTGKCTCEPGWQPPFCDKKCSAGYYGQNCRKACPGCDGTCEPTDGRCIRCHAGWYGDSCDKRCETGCKDESCRKLDGHCTCRPGYRGHKCDQECSTGLWGDGCAKRCSENCLSQNNCNKVDGSCACNPGFTGLTCHQTCDSGTYGSGCTGTCSSHCVDSTDKCNRTDGSCSCRDGYVGRTCKAKCDEGFYGKGCSQQCGCLSMSACNHVDGTCVDGKCLRGKKGPTCDMPCEEGTFGINCEGTCFCKEGHAGCNKVNGTCASGQCLEGREGAACQMLRNNLTNTSALYIGLGVGVTFVIVMIVALVLLVSFMRRRRTRKRPGKINNKTSHIVAFPNTNHGTEVKNEPKPDNKERLIPTEQVDVAEASNGNVMSANVTSHEAPECLTNENMGIRVADFPNYVRDMKETEKGFQQEYESLPTGLQAPCEVGSTIEASVRNRFKNIIAYDHSRVFLKGDKPILQYINANFINGFGKTKDFVAAQGPVKETAADFIQMLWEQKVPLIVMVTNLKEKGKPKCYQYWPDQTITGKITHRGITVRKLKEETFPHYIIRQLELETDSAKQPLTQVQYISWPDHGVPESPAAFLDFHQRAQQLYQPEIGPTVVHCSAGVGRTGTFLAVDYLLEQAEHEGYLSVASCVKRMREDRVNMVQSLDQYVFIHESVLEALHCGRTVYDALSYDAFASSVDKKELMTQFEILDKLKPTVSANSLEVATAKENRHKNRSDDVLPNTNWRPLLMTDAKVTNDYINAVFVHAYQKKHAYIATQSPLPATVVDLWRMVLDYECSTIIALNDTGNNEACPNYWGNQEEQIGPFIISEASETESNGYVRRQLNLKYKKEERKVMQFQVKSWTHGTLPAAATLLSLYEEVKAWQQESGDSRIIVHCLYGAAETGLFLCLCHVCDKIGGEQEVDVFHAVQLIRKSYPLFITNLEQYEWLHQTAYEYISSFSMYANFK